MGLLDWWRGPKAVEANANKARKYAVRLEENPYSWTIKEQWKWELIDEKGGTVEYGAAQTEAKALESARVAADRINAYENRTIKMIEL